MAKTIKTGTDPKATKGTDPKASLSVYRKQLDEIDDKLLKLYEERMGICEKIGEYKKENGLAAYDEKRENEKLDDVLSKVKNKKYADGAAQLFLTIMQASTEMQEALILGEDYFDDFENIDEMGELDDFNWDGEPIAIDLELGGKIK